MYGHFQNFTDICAWKLLVRVSTLYLDIFTTVINVSISKYK